MKFKDMGDNRWLIEKTGAMRVPGLIYAAQNMLPKLEADHVAEQVMNAACLPGIVRYSYAMPDAHWGYGFPIGAVAAFDCQQGVISPGGVGYDISCGVRLLRTGLSATDAAKFLPRILDELYRTVPSGVGKGGEIKLGVKTLKHYLISGARYAVECGYGSEEDLSVCEDGGHCADADPGTLSARALERGLEQLGTLGSGNHFIEVQRVDKIFNPAAARAFGLHEDQLVVLMHTGSRGLGYQICDDYVKIMNTAMPRYGITVPDRQLACAPVLSEEGKKYYRAMNCAANYARANRHIIAHLIKQAFVRALAVPESELKMGTVYDVSHNLVKIETHELDGKQVRLCVHRKGATRAFAPGHPDVPEKYRTAGQPVFIPGSMGAPSFVLTGTARAMHDTFGSVCHGAGRLMSRTQASKSVSGETLLRELRARGVEVRTGSVRALSEEAPCAYKDAEAVSRVCADAGIADMVARLNPLGVIKG